MKRNVRELPGSTRNWPNQLIVDVKDNKIIVNEGGAWGGIRQAVIFPNNKQAELAYNLVIEENTFKEAINKAISLKEAI